MVISNTYCFDNKPIFIDPGDVTEEEWAFLCRIFGENAHPNDCLRFVIESYNVVTKPGKEEGELDVYIPKEDRDVER